MKHLRDKIRLEIIKKGIITDEKTIKRLVEEKLRKHIRDSWIDQVREQFKKRTG